MAVVCFSPFQVLCILFPKDKFVVAQVSCVSPQVFRRIHPFLDFEDRSAVKTSELKGTGTIVKVLLPHFRLFISVSEIIVPSSHPLHLYHVTKREQSYSLKDADFQATTYPLHKYPKPSSPRRCLRPDQPAH